MNRFRASVLATVVILVLAVASVVADSESTSPLQSPTPGVDETTVGAGSSIDQQETDSTDAQSSQPQAAETSASNASDGGYQLLYSTKPRRTDPKPLDGATVSGKAYIFVVPETGIKQIDFALDGKSFQVEKRVPWDFAGGSANSANPWNTTTVANENHQITATLQLEDASTQTLAATIVVDNGNQGRPTAIPGETPTPTPEPTPTPPPKPGDLELTATYNTIGIGLTAPDEGLAHVRYRTPNGAWHDAFLMRHTVDTYYGSILFLSPNTSYDVEITTEVRTVRGTITTREDAIPQASELSISHRVCPSNCDFASLEAAWSDAPAGAVVEVAPGTYDAPTTTRTTPITLVAQHPAVDDSGTTINADRRSIIAAPNATFPDDIDEWELVTLTGPKTGEAYKVWRWQTGEQDESSYLTIDGWRVAQWDRKGDDVDGWTVKTPAGWAEVLYRSDRFNYGFRMFGTKSDGDERGMIYARFPDDLNPNEHVVRLGNEWMKINGDDARISGFELQQVTVNFGPAARFGIVDHNLFDEGVIWFSGDRPGQYPSDTTIEYNVMEGSAVWTEDPERSAERGWTLPWSFIKSSMYVDGVRIKGWTRLGAGIETHAIHGKGGAVRTVIRHNRISGYFNGFGGYNAEYDRNAWRDMDIHDNELFDIGDDIIEPEHQVINWRVWNNDMHDMLSAISTGPLKFGPLYVVGNSVTDIGNHGSPPDGRGETHNGKAFKYSGSSNGAMVVVIGNTFATAPNGGLTNGGLQAAGGGPNQEFFYLRNNLFLMTRYAFDFPWDSWDEDYNHWYTSDKTRCLGDENSLAEYRAKWPWGDHSNPAGECHAPVTVDDPRLVDAGVIVPNLDERFDGKAPDIGWRGREIQN